MYFTKKLLKILIFILIIKCSFSFEKNNDINSIIAIVNNEIITKEELENKINLLLFKNKNIFKTKILEKQMLNNIITDTIQLQLAKKKEINVNDKTIKNFIKDYLMMQEKKSLKEFKKLLEKSKIPYKIFYNQIRTEITLSKLQQQEIHQKITISKENINHFLETSIGKKKTKTKFFFSYSLIKINKNNIIKTKKIKEIIKNKKIRKNNIFIIRKKNINRKNINQIPNLFVKYLIKLQINKISNPIYNNQGIYILKALDKKNVIDKKIKTNIKYINLNKKRNNIKKDNFLKKNKTKKNLGKSEYNKISINFYKQLNKLISNKKNPPIRTTLGISSYLIKSKENKINKNKIIQIISEIKFKEIRSIWIKNLREKSNIEILYKI